MNRLFGLICVLSFIPSVHADTLPPMLGERYDIGGYQLHIYCLGKGSPTVIIDTGLGDDSWDWKNVVAQSSQKTKTCVYDRPGYGWSDVGPRPRHSKRIAYELDLLLKAADLPPPYVLVGHSFGGFNMRVFAQEHPNSTAGLVLIDSSHEKQYDALGIKLPPPDKGERSIFVTIPLDKMDPDDTKNYTLRDRAFRSASFEIAALSQSSEQVRNSGAIPAIPLIVVSRGKNEWYGSPNAEKKEKTWVYLQQDLARLSPISKHLFANHSGHDIPVEQPDIIVDAIAEALNLAMVIRAP